MTQDILTALRSLSSPARAKTNAWFFKTGSGQYWFDDKFLDQSRGIFDPQN